MRSYYVIIHLSWDDKFRDTPSLLETIVCAFAQDMRPIEIVDLAEPLTPDSMPIKIDMPQPLELIEQNRNNFRSQAYNVARNWLFPYASHGEIPSAFELVHWSRR